MKRISLLSKTLACSLFFAAPFALQAADQPAGGASTGNPAARGAAAGSGTAVPGATKPSAGADAARTAGKSTLAKQDEQFLQKAAQGGIMEVKLGEVASQKATDPAVKELGAMMVKDHGKTNQEVNELAGKKGVALPTELDSKHQSTVDRLSKQTGEEFDKAYVAEMVSAHKKDVSEFEKASKSAQDPDIKAFAAKTLPTLQGHLQHVQGMKKGGKQ